MPIQLTTTYKDYTEVKIIDIRAGTESKTLFVKFQYGDTVAGKWVSGDIYPDEKLVRNKEAETDGVQETEPADPAYDLLTGSASPNVTFTDMSADPRWAKKTTNHPTHGNLDVYVQITYVAISDGLYQYALDKDWYDGVIV